MPDLHASRRRSRNNGATTEDRLPPNDPTTEFALLGCLMQEPGIVFPQCEAGLAGGEEAFYDLRHRVIYQTMRELFQEESPLDAVTLQYRLRFYGTLDQVGGLDLIANLGDDVIVQSAPEYIQNLNRLYILRGLIRQGTEIVRQAYESTDDPRDLIEDLVTRVLSIV